MRWSPLEILIPSDYSQCDGSWTKSSPVLDASNRSLSASLVLYPPSISSLSAWFGPSCCHCLSFSSLIRISKFRFAAKWIVMHCSMRSVEMSLYAFHCQSGFNFVVTDRSARQQILFQIDTRKQTGDVGAHRCDENAKSWLVKVDEL